MRLIYMLLIAILVFSSCEKDFVPAQPGTEKKMVVNCLLDNDTFTKVFLSESSSGIGTGPLKSIEGAQVELYVNDTLEQVLPYISSDSANTFGRYHSLNFATPDKKYALRITHPAYGVVTAQDFFPPKPRVLSHSVISYGNSANNYTATYKLRFLDVTPGLSYYRINIWHTGQILSNNNQGNPVLRNFEMAQRPEMQVTLQDTARDGRLSILFSDAGFDGQSKEISLQFKSLDLQNIAHAQLYVMIAQVSEAHYKYFKTLEQFKDGIGGPESAQVYSNINNGYGIFMGQSVNKLITTLK